MNKLFQYLLILEHSDASGSDLPAVSDMARICALKLKNLGSGLIIIITIVQC